MTERDDLPLSGPEQDLLAAYAEQNAMPREARARVWDRLAVPLPVGPGGGGGGGASAGPAAAKASAGAATAGSAATGSAWVIAASIAAVAAVGTAFWRPWQRPQPPQQAVAVAPPNDPHADEAQPAPTPPAQPAPTPPVQPEPAARPQSGPQPAAQTNAPREPQPAVGDDNDLAAELELAEASRDALNRGANEAAAREARAYLEQFPKGSFAPEAAAIEVLAACRSDSTDAAAKAEAFLGSHTRESRLRKKIEKECPRGDGTPER